MARITPLLLGLALLVSACEVMGGSSGRSGVLRIETDRNTYSGRQAVAVRLDNGRSIPIVYDNCATILERKTKDGWAVYDGMVCTPIAAAHDVRIDAGEVFSDSLVWFNGDEDSGTYRFEFSVTDTEGHSLSEHERRTGAITLEQ